MSQGAHPSHAFRTERARRQTIDRLGRQTHHAALRQTGHGTMNHIAEVVRLRDVNPLRRWGRVSHRILASEVAPGVSDQTRQPHRPCLVCAACLLDRSKQVRQTLDLVNFRINRPHLFGCLDRDIERDSHITSARRGSHRVVQIRPSRQMCVDCLDDPAFKVVVNCADRLDLVVARETYGSIPEAQPTDDDPWLAPRSSRQCHRVLTISQLI